MYKSEQPFSVLIVSCWLVHLGTQSPTVEQILSLSCPETTQKHPPIYNVEAPPLLSAVTMEQNSFNGHFIEVLNRNCGKEVDDYIMSSFLQRHKFLPLPLPFARPFFPDGNKQRRVCSSSVTIFKSLLFLFASSFHTVKQIDNTAVEDIAPSHNS